MPNRNTVKHLAHYLARHGQPECGAVPIPNRRFDNVVIIPCYDESPDCLEAVFSRLGVVNNPNATPAGKESNLLAIVVVNAPDDAPPEPLARTRVLWRSLVDCKTEHALWLDNISAGHCQNTNDAATKQSSWTNGETASHDQRNLSERAGYFRWTRTANGIHVLAINRIDPNLRLPRRQGVGLARKIGADTACALILKGVIRSPWLYFTDADVRLPGDYFGYSSTRVGSLLFPYRHQASAFLPQRCVVKPNPTAIQTQMIVSQRTANRTLAERATIYEIHLRYYVDRLRYAGSPYAFHTIGSTMAIHAEVYAKVRGVPKRNAAEDFHLLNKAAKVAPVHTLTGPEIVIRARLSNRVPFGTGPALRTMQDASTFQSYAHESFEFLREAISFINTEATISSRTRQLLEELGFFHRLVRAKAQHRHPHTLRKALHQWFDALRTLRFIHLARRYHSDRPLLPMLDGLFGETSHLTNLREREYKVPRIVGTNVNSHRSLQ